MIRLIIRDQFYSIQSLQRSPILQNNYWSGTFFAVSYSKLALALLVKNLCSQLFHIFLLGEVLASVQGNNEVGLWNMESQFRQLVLWASSSPLLSTNQSNSQSVTAMQSIHNHEMNVLITGNYLIYKGGQQFLPYFLYTDSPMSGNYHI